MHLMSLLITGPGPGCRIRFYRSCTKMNRSLVFTHPCWFLVWYDWMFSVWMGCAHVLSEWANYLAIALDLCNSLHIWYFAKSSHYYYWCLECQVVLCHNPMQRSNLLLILELHILYCLAQSGYLVFIYRGIFLPLYCSILFNRPLMAKGPHTMANLQ